MYTLGSTINACKEVKKILIKFLFSDFPEVLISFTSHFPVDI